MKNSNLCGRFHDFEIVSIEINRNENRLIMALVNFFDGEKKKLILDGVQKLYCEGLSIQNVVLDIQIFTEPENTNYYEFCREKLGLKYDFFSKNQGSAVLYVEPSVGLELTCVFSAVSIE